MALNSLFSWFIKKRIHQIELFKQYPHEVQEELLTKLIANAKNTTWGKQYSYAEILDYSQFKERVPLQDYTTLKPWVERMFKDEQNLVWSSDVRWFAKSSGTTSDKSKFIPVTRESLDECHYKVGKDMMSIYYNNYPNGKIYNGKHLIIGGSAQLNELGKDSYFGDFSAIALQNLPWWAEMKRTPSLETALHSDWEEKLDRMVRETSNEDVCMIAGVPSWTLVLINRILEHTDATSIFEVWPNLEAFFHGGVKFEPYKNEYEKLFQGKVNYLETYNASEGFFGIQDQVDSNELLLMLDYGIYFEFIPMEHFNGIDSKVIHNLVEVELNKNYALVISTNGGLWRYILGDTISFSSREPYRFYITGRTTQFINAFGEELIVDNTDKAIGIACQQTNAQIRDYTLAPIYMEDKKSGGHEWLLEFSKNPNNLEAFMQHLDTALKSLNSDYEAKRSNNLSIAFPIVTQLRAGTFERWLKQKGKLGGQHKIPRLSNNRTHLEEIKQCALQIA